MPRIDATPKNDKPEFTMLIDAFMYTNISPGAVSGSTDLHIICKKFIDSPEVLAGRYRIRRAMYSIALNEQDLSEGILAKLKGERPYSIGKYREIFTDLMFHLLVTKRKGVAGLDLETINKLAYIYFKSKEPDAFTSIKELGYIYLFEAEGIGTYTKFAEAFISTEMLNIKNERFPFELVRNELKTRFESALRPGGVVFEAMHREINGFLKNEDNIYGKGPYVLSPDVQELLNSIEEGVCPAYQTVQGDPRRRIVSVITGVFIDNLPEYIIQGLML